MINTRMNKGVVVIKQRKELRTYDYKYYEFGEEIKVDRIDDNLYINYGIGQKGVRIGLSFYDKVIVYCIDSNTPYKVIESSNKGTYVERPAEFEDHVITNFVKEEIIRGFLEVERMR